MKQKGFTLIELLAVIVILTLIALITMPIVLNTIDNAKKGAFRASVYGIIESVNSGYYLDIINDKEPKEVIYTYIDGKETSNISGKSLNYKGSKPEGGNIIVSKSGKISLALHSSVWCATKNIDEEEIIIDKISKDECVMPIPMPRIELIGSDEIEIEINTEYIDEGINAYSIEGNDVTDKVEIKIIKNGVLVDSVDTSLISNYEITYSLEEDEKYVEVKRIVNIIDTNPPILTIPSNVSIKPHEVETFDLMEGVNVTDNSNETIEITIIGNISTIPGIYKITYIAKDSSNNIIEKNRYITVLDDEGPVITLNGDNPMTIYLGDTYIEPGATAIDDVDGDISENIIISGNVSNIIGEYEIRYEVNDSALNTTVAIRTVNVITPPVPTSWAFLRTFSSSGTWVVPETRWYKIHVIGKGGNGGSGGKGSPTGNNSGGGGGGGGGGGLAISNLYLTEGTTLPITVTSVQTIFNDIVANAGSNGANVTAAGGYTAGKGSSGGTASGGNYINLSGRTGGDGIAYPTGGKGGDGGAYWSSSIYYSKPTAIGGNVGTSSSKKGSNGGNASTGTSDAPMYGGAGAGGGGGYGQATGSYGGSGGTGAPGGVVIEISQ